MKVWLMSIFYMNNHFIAIGYDFEDIFNLIETNFFKYVLFWHILWL